MLSPEPGKSRPASIIVHGPTGAGKTLLVRQFVHERKRELSDKLSIIWISAAPREDFVNDCAHVLKLLSKTTGGASTVEGMNGLLCHELERPDIGAWLLVVDNVKSVDDLRWPVSSQGTCLYITTDRGFLNKHLYAEPSRVIKLGRPRIEEAAEMLRQRVSEKEMVDDQPAANALLRKLSYMPLAITQAAAYINYTRWSAAEYLRFLNTGEVAATSALDGRGQTARRRRREIPSPFPQPVSTTDDFGTAIALPDFGIGLSSSNGNDQLLDSRYGNADLGGSSLALPAILEHTLQSTNSRWLPRIRTCYVLIFSFGLIIGSSLAVGLYYSIAQDRMGDGFTTAEWITAAGTLMIAPAMAVHYPKCKCWAGYETLSA